MPAARAEGIGTMDLDELERLHREATPGPWRCVEHSYGGCKVTNEEGDAILLEDDFRLIAAMRNALPKLISRARLYEQMDRHACDQVAEIDRLRVRIAEADRDRDTWATSAHKIANERDAAARDLAAVTVERYGLKKDLFEARNALLREGMERDAARAECERLSESLSQIDAIDTAVAMAERDEARARLAEVERERDAAKQLIASLEERISDVEDRDDDARMVCEWAATVAAGGTDVRAAARRYLMGEKPPRLAALESLAEDARTCAEWCKHMDVGSGAETGAAARRVLAGIGGK